MIPILFLSEVQDLYMRVLRADEHPKVRMFARITGLYSEESNLNLDKKQAEFYLKVIQQIDEYSNPDKPFTNFERGSTNVVLAMETARSIF